MKKILLAFLLLTSSFTFAQIRHWYGITIIDTLITTSISGDTVLSAGQRTQVDSLIGVNAIVAYKLNAADTSGLSNRINAKASTAQLSDSLNLKLYKDFADTLQSTTTPDGLDIVITKNNESGDLQGIALSALPIQNAVQSALANKVDLSFMQAMYDSLAQLRALIGTHVVVVDSPTVPTNLASTHTTGTTGNIILTWDQTGSVDSFAVYRSSDGSNFSVIAWVDSGTTTYSDAGISAHSERWYFLKSYNGIIYSNPTEPISDFVTKNYYVSNAIVGTGTGLSWATAKSFAVFCSANTAQAGDTVFINGGVSGLTYDGAANQNVGYSLVSTNGTLLNPVIFIGASDAGHNGTPTFSHSTSADAVKSYSINLSNVHDIKIEGLNFINVFASSDARSIASEGYANNYTIQNCTFTIAYGSAIQLGQYQSNIKLLNNTITTGIINNLYSNNAIYIGANSTNIEVGYNDILIGNSTASGSPAHKDFMQIYGTGGTNNIHNNFLVNAHSNETQGFYFDAAYGTWNIYNNIVSYSQIGDTSNAMFNISAHATGGIDNSALNLTVNMYNNTFYNNTTTAISTGDGHCDFRTCDTVRFKNNLFHLASTGAISLSGYNDFSNNVYNKTSHTANGETSSSTSDFTLVDSSSTTATDYKLDTGSSGIDEGVDLSSIFTTDYRDTTRTGTWDVGAFEIVASDIADITAPAASNLAFKSGGGDLKFLGAQTIKLRFK